MKNTIADNPAARPSSPSVKLIAFELPVVMSFLSFVNVIHANGFRQKRSVAWVGIMVLSAFLTPADILSMLLMAIPLILLYELGIFFAFLVEQESEVHV